MPPWANYTNFVSSEFQFCIVRPLRALVYYMLLILENGGELFRARRALSM